MHNDRFADSFVALWEPAPAHREWMPSLFLNGTSVEKGNRIITSNLRLTNIFLDADAAAEKLATQKTPATKAACNIPVSTAALMSARFTYVSPAGRFPDGTHVSMAVTLKTREPRRLTKSPLASRTYARARRSKTWRLKSS